MQLHKAILPFIAMLSLFSAATIARAADGQPPPPAGPEMKKHCGENPDQCRERRERMQNWCKDHAERCEEMKKKHEQMREECRKDPEACKKKREEMREKFRQRMEEKCKQDPQKCAEWKDHHRHGDGPPPDAPGDQTPGKS